MDSQPVSDTDYGSSCADAGELCVLLYRCRMQW